MNHPILKPTLSNIISLWFGADTPIRRYKVRMNPELWSACEQISHHWFAATTTRYRRGDQIRFARAVQSVIGQPQHQSTL